MQLSPALLNRFHAACTKQMNGSLVGHSTVALRRLDYSHVREASIIN